VADIEYAWNPEHMDLSGLRRPGSFIANGTPHDWNPSENPHHGTAVMGVVGADANTFGVTGLVPDAALAMVNEANTEGSARPNAISLATEDLSAGDVLMLEMQIAGPNGGTAYVPAEWEPAVHAAVRTATAKGIVVVAAAGNGGENLDAADMGNPFPQGRPDSGAIVVGAGNAPGCDPEPARSRAWWSSDSSSTYGSRVDLQGWGECVTTTGKGDLFGADGPNALYTGSFTGTSSATPIVASAAAALSSAWQAARGTPPSPAQVREALVATGIPQANGPYTGKIGPLPDVAAALRRAGLLANDTNLVRNPSFEADLTGWGSFGGTLSRVAVTGAPHGGYVAQATRASGTSFSVSDNMGDATPTVASTSAGATYIATATVRAATGASVGKQLRLTLRERTGTSGAVSRETSTTAALSSGFRRVAVAAVAAAPGKTMGLRAEQLGAAAGHAFQADTMSLVRAASLLGSTTPGPGWTQMTANGKRASAATLDRGVDVARLRVYADGKGAGSAATVVRGLIYADAGGAPGTRLARTGEVRIDRGRGAGWLDLNLPQPVRSAPARTGSACTRAVGRRGATHRRPPQELCASTRTATPTGVRRPSGRRARTPSACRCTRSAAEGAPLGA